MRKIFVTFLIFTLFFIPCISNAEIDGGDWSKMSSVAKRAFVLGWHNAGEEALDLIVFINTVLVNEYDLFPKRPHDFSSINSDSSLNEEQKKSVKKVVEEVIQDKKELFLKMTTPDYFRKNSGVGIYDINTDQVANCIDQIYSDPRVKHWKIRKIMPIVRGRLKEGWTLRDIDEVISYRIRESGLVEKLKSKNLSDEERDKAKREFESLKRPKVLD